MWWISTLQESQHSKKYTRSSPLLTCRWTIESPEWCVQLQILWILTLKGIITLEEIHKKQTSINIKERRNISIYILSENALELSLKTVWLQLAIANPGWQVIHKMKLARLVDKIGETWIFLTVGEAVEACSGAKMDDGCGCWCITCPGTYGYMQQ